MSAIDLGASLGVLGLVLAGAAAYAVRVRVAGAARYARVDAAGGSPLLSKGALEMGYFWLQPVARACVRAEISAAAITLASLALAFAAGAALALGHFGVAAALAAASSLGDAVDGLVARATGSASDGGALLDAASDRYGEFFLLGGLALHYHQSLWLLSLPLLALLGSYMVSYGSAKAEAMGVKPPRGAMRRVERATYLCAGVLLTPISAALAARGLLPGWVGEAPVVAALALVGAVANVSAVRRLRAVAAAKAARPAQRPATVLTLAPPEGAPRPSRPAAGIGPR